MQMQEIYKQALAGKDIPILILDNQWHQLFEYLESAPEIDRLSDELNKLLQRQGKMTTQSKDIRALKKKLMKDVMNLADEMEKHPGSKKKEKEMADLRRLLLECNDKLDNNRDELKVIPEKIQQVNYELMLATMKLCYDALQENTDIIETLVEKIAKIRMELKKSEIIKEEMMDANQKLYSYMHHIFGASVMEIFDLRYNPTDRKIADKKTAEKGKKET